ncbi:hypothetical protein GCM10009554_65860 [Kribbella koreensis]|uniref:Uncharacterized protein n=1 Tax=Kribbella koreensis TaxID=57909 RepID=A0ABN1RFU3_9ACTN
MPPHSSLNSRHPTTEPALQRLSRLPLSELLPLRELPRLLLGLLRRRVVLLPVLRLRTTRPRLAVLRSTLTRLRVLRRTLLRLPVVRLLRWRELGLSLRLSLGRAVLGELLRRLARLLRVWRVLLAGRRRSGHKVSC